MSFFSERKNRNRTSAPEAEEVWSPAVETDLRAASDGMSSKVPLRYPSERPSLRPAGMSVLPALPKDRTGFCSLTETVRRGADARPPKNGLPFMCEVSFAGAYSVNLSDAYGSCTLDNIDTGNVQSCIEHFVTEDTVTYMTGIYLGEHGTIAESGGTFYVVRGESIVFEFPYLAYGGRGADGVWRLTLFPTVRGVATRAPHVPYLFGTHLITDPDILPADPDVPFTAPQSLKSLRPRFFTEDVRTGASGEYFGLSRANMEHLACAFSGHMIMDGVYANRDTRFYLVREGRALLLPNDRLFTEFDEDGNGRLTSVLERMMCLYTADDRSSWVTPPMACRAVPAAATPTDTCYIATDVYFADGTETDCIELSDTVLEMITAEYGSREADILRGFKRAGTMERCLERIGYEEAETGSFYSTGDFLRAFYGGRNPEDLPYLRMNYENILASLKNDDTKKLPVEDHTVTGGIIFRFDGKP